MRSVLSASVTRPTTRLLLLALLATPLGCFDADPPVVADDAAKDDVAPVDDTAAPVDDLGAAPDAARDAGFDAPADVPLTIGCTRDDACPAAQHCDVATHACVAGCHADDGCAGLS
ncbi:MAG: hypothetical protein JWM10_940, partial [Myxococcaceae bacterium]|nr:hypothetical protein [Myxococcaceae bacterium]